MQKTLAKLKSKKKNGGFTLIELMVVLAIIAVLAAVMVPQYMQYLGKSKISADKATAGGILSAAKVAATDTATVTSDFKVTWDGTNVTVAKGADGSASDTELAAVAQDIAKSLAVSYSSGASFTLGAQGRSSSTKTYVAYFTVDDGVTKASTDTNEIGWWPTT